MLAYVYELETLISEIFKKKEKLFEDITPRGGGVCVRVESSGGEKSIFFSPLSARVEPGNIDLVFSCV